MVEWPQNQPTEANSLSVYSRIMYLHELSLADPLPGTAWTIEALQRMLYRQNIVAQKSDLVTPWRDLQWWFHFWWWHHWSLIPCSFMLVYLHAFDVVAFWVPSWPRWPRWPSWPSWPSWHSNIFQLSQLSNLQHAAACWTMLNLLSWSHAKHSVPHWSHVSGPRCDSSMGGTLRQWWLQRLTVSFSEQHNHAEWRHAEGFRWTEVVRLRRCPWMAGRGTSQGD